MIKPIKPKKSKCKNCRGTFIKTSAFACCGMACALDYLDKAAAKKAKREIVNKERSYRKDLIDLNRKDVRWQHKQCQPVFNKLRRLQEFKWFKDRGIEPYCISCGNPLGGDEWACGHLRSVGSNSQLRYDPINTYLQHNVRCNKNLSGDINGTATTKGYKIGLIDRFGADEALWITDYCEIHNDTIKWDWQLMEQWRKDWNKEIRGLEKYLNV